MKLLLLLLLTIPNYQKIRVIVETIDIKGKKAPCQIKIFKDNSLSTPILDIESTGSFSANVEEGVYIVQAIRCIEHTIVWRVDRPKKSVIIIDTDCDEKNINDKIL